jgi:hypothetical protein
MEKPNGLASKIIAVLRQKILPLIILLVLCEAAIWLSGKASLVLLLLSFLALVAAAILGAAVRVWLDARHKQ